MTALITFSLLVRVLEDPWFLNANGLRIIRFQVRFRSENRRYFRAGCEENLSGFCGRSPSVSEGNFVGRVLSSTRYVLPISPSLTAPPPTGCLVWDPGSGF